MKYVWPILVLWVFSVLLLCLRIRCLDRKPESAPQEKLTYLVPWCGNCFWFKFKKCGSPAGTLNYSLCHHTVREANCFDACHEKTTGSLMRTTESVTPDAVFWWLGMSSASELGKVWEKLFKVIPRPSVRYNDLYCGSCVLVGNLKVFQRASGLSNSVTTVFRWVLRRRRGAGRPRPVPRVVPVSVLLPRVKPAPVPRFKTVGNQSTGFTCGRNAGAQGSWRQLLLLLLKLSGLAWTSDALSQEILEDDLVP
ncbi:uncharacterized protein C20orf173 homolog [Sturnira hondurensis]|uniref:uncharacterized protein C20orf173 homolog n=1 Tax=Sturnira hondurensis TaxID=192404 RepID=UPI0018794FAB|nr:uncharacterized protein C20orf173 homolog [Sturnira hondurensis]